MKEDMRPFLSSAGALLPTGNVCARESVLACFAELYVLFSSVALLAVASHPTGKHSIARLQPLFTQGSEPAVSMKTV